MHVLVAWVFEQKWLSVLSVTWVRFGLEPLPCLVELELRWGVMPSRFTLSLTPSFVSLSSRALSSPLKPKPNTIHHSLLALLSPSVGACSA